MSSFDYSIQHGQFSGKDRLGNLEDQVSAMANAGSLPNLRVYNPKDYGAVLDGVTDDNAAVLAAFAAMKADGTHATGTLQIPGKCALSPLTLDGGYANLASTSANAGATDGFRLITTGAIVPLAGTGPTLSIQGFYNPEIEVRVQGGGSRRTVTDAAITASAATLTSATAAFTAADVGSVVRVTGAGATVGGVAQDLWATITAFTNSTTVTVSVNAATTVSGASAAISTVAVHVENIDGGSLNVHGWSYAGTLFHLDAAASSAKRIKGTTIERVYAVACGQALYMRSQTGVGLAPLRELNDENCIENSIFALCSDMTIDSVELSAPATNQNGIVFEACNTMHIGVLDLGSSGNGPPNSVFKWYGNADGANSDASTIALLRVGQALSGGVPVQNGAEIIDTTSLHIGAVETKNCLKAVHVTGSKVTIDYGHSLTKDQDWLYIDGDTFSLLPEVHVGNGFWRNLTQHLAYVNASATGAGRLDIAGYVDTPNQSGTAGIAMIDVQGTAFKLDVTGLKQLHRSTMSGGSINHVTAGLTTGLLASNLTNTPMAVLANPAAVTLTSGTALQNDPNANNGMTMFITVGIVWSAGAGTCQVAIGNTSAGVVSLQQISKGASGLAENDLYGAFVLPPDWWIKVTLTGTAAFGTNHKYFA